MRVITLLICLWFAAPAAHAWGDYGHVTVCEIAYRELTPKARAEVNRILRSDGEYTALNRACTDPDHPRMRPSEHFVNYDRSLAAVTGPGCDAAAKCAISGIQSDVAILSSSSSTDAQKAAALKALGHWVGDIHQPLHISFQDDRGGNLIKKQGRCSQRDLHAVWDTCLIERGVFGIGLFQEALGYGKFTRAYRAADRLQPMITQALRDEWGASEPWTWAAESYAIALRPDVGYCTQRQGACWYAPDNKTYDEGEEQRRQLIDDAYIERFTPVIEQRLQQAGVRLAVMLNAAFDP